MKFKCPKCGCTDYWQDLHAHGVGSVTFYRNGKIYAEIVDIESEIPEESKNQYVCNNCDEIVTALQHEKPRPVNDDFLKDAQWLNAPSPPA